MFKLIIHAKAKARIIPFKFSSYFIGRGFAIRAKSKIQLKTNTLHYRFLFS